MHNNAAPTHSKLSDVRQKAHRGSSSSVSALWREKIAHEISATDLVAAGQLLRKTSLLGESKWQAARGGSAADAIAIAVAKWPMAALTARTDLIMTALMYSAMTGSAAAAVVMSHALRQMPNAKKKHKRIAASWLARNLEIAIAKRARRPSIPTRLRKPAREAGTPGCS